jgi:hypothetical protein
VTQQGNLTNKQPEKHLDVNAIHAPAKSAPVQLVVDVHRHNHGTILYQRGLSSFFLYHF